MKYLTLKQFAEQQRRNYAAQTDGVTLKEMRECYPDSYYATDHYQFADRLAQQGYTFGTKDLNNIHMVHGGQSLSLLFKFYPSCRPEFYVHPDFRD